jgi:hypothetical protein
MIGGIGVFYPDKTATQCIGIKPSTYGCRNSRGQG